MWLITPRVISVVEQLVIDIEERNLALLETRIDGLLRFARGSVGSSLLSTNIPAGAASLALVGDRMLNLSLPEIVCGGEPESRVPWDDLVTLIDQLTYYHPSTREWFETKGREQLRQASENATLTSEN